MRRHIHFRNLLSVVLLLLLTTCNEAGVHSPIDNDTSIPGSVNNVKVKELHGAAKITYELPENNNALYVEAVVKLSKEQNKVVKSSYYKNEINIEGFADTSVYNVKLYTVNRAEKKSKPVSVQVQPLTPPVIDIFKTLKLERTFGGIKITFQNQSEANVTISIITEDSLGDLGDADKFYTQKMEGTFAVHGFPPEKRRFGVYVRDKFNNRSDTVFKEVIPIFEQMVPKSGFQAVHLPTDTYKQHCCGNGIRDLWDGIHNVNDPIFHTAAGLGFPQWFTFDMGVKVQLDRFIKYARGSVNGSDVVNDNGAFKEPDPKVFELWGSNNPNPDGTFDNTWIKLGRFEAIQPSGDGPPITQEDLQYALVDGEHFDIPNAEHVPAVRYLRFKTITTFGTSSNSAVNMAELTFYGNIKE